MNPPPPLPNSLPSTGTLATSGAVPPSIAPTTPRTHIGKYEVQGEIGRGGMGCVLKGHDPDLDRDLAIKVLHRGSEERTDLVQRFFEEARVSGQLQHPGIVPVHEVGRSPADESGPPRPYFTMKLVQGDTLADLLRKRPSPSDDLPRFLTIFEQVCQTLAYAHAHGVIHRDLKPANIMVGRFGEAQVMDWGLAKVLNPAALDTGDSATTSRVSSGREVEGWKSRDGAILGTPAYMPPEQARGDADELDERADVFGLGGILCHILTGMPTYVGGPGRSIMQMAIQGDLAATYARLAASGADAELIDLARACLSAPREARPRHAGIVAERIAAYRASVQERLRAAELERARAEAREAEAQAKARAERRARRLTVGLAAAVLLLGALGGGAYLWVKQVQRDREADKARREEEEIRRIDGDLREADTLRSQQQWAAAHKGAERAEDALRSAPFAPAELRRGAERLLADLTFVQELERIRAPQHVVRYAEKDQKYEEAFRRLGGLDVAVLSPDESARRIAASPVREAVIGALEDWAFARDRHKDKSSRNRLLTIAQKADPGNDWRTRFLAAMAADDWTEVKRLRAKVVVADQLPGTLLLLSRALSRPGNKEEDGTVLLEQARESHPGDFWINLELGVRHLVAKPARNQEALRCYSVAVALRPGNASALNDMGNALKALGRLDEAIAAYKRALRAEPEFIYTLVNLSQALRQKGQLDEAEEFARKAVKVEPKLMNVHVNLGYLLLARGRFRDAEDSFRHALKPAPEDPNVLYALGQALHEQGRFEEADKILRQSLAAEDDALTWSELAEVQAAQARYKEAEVCYRRSIALEDHYLPRFSLSHMLVRQGRLREALEELRRGVELKKQEGRNAQVEIERARMLERLIGLDAQLDAILKGEKSVPRSDTLAVAELCYIKGKPASAVRFFAEAFATDKGLLAVNAHSGAACAARASTGRDADAAGLDAAERNRLRGQAYEWMRIYIDHRANQLLKAGVRRTPIRKDLQNRRADPDLACVRDPDELAKLDKTEQEKWRKLWSDVDALLKRLQEP